MVKSEIRGALASTNIKLSYVNPLEGSKLEIEYILPLEKDSVLAKFEATIDDRTIYTKVAEKGSAREKYDDAIAGGKAAILAERKSKDEVLIVKLGNLLPG